jgi:hypothetical protein
MVSFWDTGEHLAGRVCDVLCLPLSREIDVPIRQVWFPPESSIHYSSTSENAAYHLIGISIGNANGASVPDTVKEGKESRNF